MADFRPETTVYLVESTGVDAENQPFFNSEGSKIAWYNSHVIHAFENYSYQRENRQYIRVKAKAGDLRKCDVILWRNSNWKWIIGNITAIEFVNPNTTEITYKVDYMQTFIEDIIWCDCWVEREMITNDWVGGQPNFNNYNQLEGLETGKLIRTRVPMPELEYQEMSLVVLSAYDEAGEENVNSSVIAGYPSGLNRIVIPMETVGRFDNMIKTYSEKGRLDGIAGVFLCPSKYASNGSLYIENFTHALAFNFIDGYQVVNARCFGPEFFCIEISNRQGAVSTFTIDEMVDPGLINLNLEGAFCGGSGGMLLYPTGIFGPNKDRGVITYNDIQVPYVGNSFANWIAQNKMGLIAEVGQAAVGIGVAVATGGALGSTLGVSSVSKAMGTLAKVSEAKASPLSIGGQAASSGLPVATKTIGFIVSLVHPKGCNVQCIDEFFSRFGYKVNRLKKPNVNTRPLWNYVKTAGAVVRGPFDYAAKTEIQNNLDNGVTFWHVPAATIGDYSDMAANKG